MKQISVIGATSPLGVHLVSKLVNEGLSVMASFRSLDRVPDKWTDIHLITPINLDLKEPHDSVAFKSDVIVWLAHLDAGRDNAFEIDTNLRAFDNCLKNIDRSLTKKIVFVSSGGSVYGPQDSIPIKEDQERRPISSYGKAKLALENRLLEFAGSIEVDVAILRPGNIYGFESPDRFSKGVVGAFLRSLDNGSRFTLIHGGNTVRDFIHVDDVCDAIFSAVNCPRGRIVWNVSTGIGHRISEVLDMIQQITGGRMPELNSIENYASDVLISVLSPELIRSESGWSAKIDLGTGIAATVKNWQSATKSQIRAV